MRVRLLVFGVLKDLIPEQSGELDLPDGATVGTLLNHFRQHAPDHSTLWSSLAVAVNREYVTAAHPLSDGDEVALLPPVSGGSVSGGAPDFALGSLVLKGMGFSPSGTGLILDAALAAEGLR